MKIKFKWAPDPLKIHGTGHLVLVPDREKIAIRISLVTNDSSVLREVGFQTYKAMYQAREPLPLVISASAENLDLDFKGTFNARERSDWVWFEGLVDGRYVTIKLPYSELKGALIPPPKGAREFLDATRQFVRLGTITLNGTLTYL